MWYMNYKKAQKYKAIKWLTASTYVILLTIGCAPTPKVAGEFSQEEFDDMAQLMADGNASDLGVNYLSNHIEEFYILDAREVEEYEVSHLPGAKWIGYSDFHPSRLEDIPKDAAIITYCSVGFRSEQIAEKLVESGYKNTYNLKGSIFQWSNEKLPLVNKAGMPTDSIHGFNKKWSKWIKYGKVTY